MIALSLAALLVCYWRTLSALVLDWYRFDTSRHGLPVLLVVLALVWRDRREFSRSEGAILPGLALVLWGGVQALVATLGVELFLGRTAFLIALAGVILFHYGWSALRVSALPLLLFALAIPLPAILYNPATGLLQTLASHMTETVLSLADVPLRWEGASMMFNGEPIRLIDAYGCLRLAMALAAGALAYGAWIHAVLWKRIALCAAVFGVAIALSSLRMIVVAWFDESSPRLSSWVLANLSPWVMVTLVFLLVVAAERLLWRRWAR